MDKEILFKPRIEEREVELSVGTVRVRGLTRTEVLMVRKATDNDPASLDGQRVMILERKMVATAMVDPKLTEADVARWQAVAPAGELDKVARVIQQLSGLDEVAERMAYKSFPGKPGA